jgi:HlyD family secretion protein
MAPGELSESPPRRGRLRDLARRARWPLVIAVVAALLGWWRWWRPVVVTVVEVTAGEVVEEAFGRGTIESQREVALGFDLSGRLSEVSVDEGSQVELGQVVARLDLDQAQADLRTAQTGIAAARSALARLAADETRARAILATAEREAARTRQLVESDAVPGAQLDDATDRVRVAQAELDRVLAQRSEATRGIEVAAGGAEQRRVAMVRASLLAPFAGLITRRLREPGDTVTPGTTVLRLVDTAQVHVLAAVDETVLSRLAVGQAARIWFPGDAAPLAGTVTRVGWEADRQTHELLVEVTPSDLRRRIAIGQRADVRIELVRQDHAVRIPLTALRADRAGSYVYVDRGGRVGTARVRLGLTGRDHTEVLDGLRAGDRILVGASAGATVPVGRRWRSR